MSEPTDEELMTHILAGDREALVPLVQRYQRPLLAYFFRLVGGDRALADDLVQDTFCKVLRQRTYTPERPFRPWLYAVATNLAHEHFRSPAQRRVDVNGVLPEGVDAAPGPEAAAVEAEESSRVRRAIGELGQEYRETVLLRYYQGLSLQEIAAVLDVPLGTVKSRLSVAARRLRTVLGVRAEVAG